MQTNVNSLGVQVTRPDKELIIMRGIPGAGKSTKAKGIVEGGKLHSTDSLIEASHNYSDFFAEMIKSGSFANLSRMHSQNLKNAKQSMDEGYSPVVIDNTNIRANEPKAYVEHALKLGYADENIRIVDVGNAGLTAEELANRNTHGVPVKKIEEMMKTHSSVGELTLKKILDAKDMYPNSDILYSAVVLDEQSHSELLQVFTNNIPEGWSKIAHHMTIAFGKPTPDKTDVGKKVFLKVVQLGVSDMAIAVRVEGYPSLNKIPHITLAVNPDGGKPVMSNDIVSWVDVANVMYVTGVVTDIKKK
jgi:predicted kinase